MASSTLLNDGSSSGMMPVNFAFVNAEDVAPVSHSNEDVPPCRLAKAQIVS